MWAWYGYKEMFNRMKTKWLVLVAVAALAAFVLACGTDETKPGSNDGVGARPGQDLDGTAGPGGNPEPVDLDLGYEVVDGLAPIESVQILTLESYPEQFVVQIISGLPNGCETFNRAVVTREGTDIRIAVYNSMPSPDQLAVISCAAIYGLHDENVALGSDFKRGTVYTVFVNDHPGEKFETGSAPLPSGSGGQLPPVDRPGEGFEYAPIESLEIIVGEDSRGTTTYYASVVWGLTNGCRESEGRQVVRVDDTTFDIRAIVSAPEGDVMCIEIYRVDSDQVYLGTIDKDLKVCALYHVYAGDKKAEFQAIAPNVRCAEPASSTPTPTPFPGGGSLIADSQALELTLKAKGAEVEYVGQSKFSQLFGTFPTELKVNGFQVLVYEFAPGTSAEKASGTVSKNGSTFENADGSVMSVMWIAPPHFYLYGNAIVLYIGDDHRTTDLLGSVANKFAGSESDSAGDIDRGDSDIDPDFTAQAATIENVTIASTRSIPAQHLIGVTIARGGSCETFKSINWRVEGREVHIDVTTQLPTAPVPCTLAIIYEDHSVNIGSKYEKGVEYDVIVNGERQGTFAGG